MHHPIIIKIWAEDVDTAQVEVNNILEESLSPEQNQCGWDYVGEIEPLTKNFLSSHHFKSYKELEKTMCKNRNKEMDHLIKRLNDYTEPLVAQFFMTKSDAPLLINTENDKLKEFIETLLKNNKDTQVPTSFSDVSKTFVNILTSILRDEHSPILYVMNQIEKLQNCITFHDDLSYTLQCLYNNYAEIPCDNKKNLSPYYFTCDRHC
jgi:hypothetical protein